MATASKTTIDVEVKKIEKQDAIVLTLTQSEADKLRAVLGYLSGDGEVRNVVNNIHLALVGAGAKAPEHSPFIGTPVLRGY